jgi:GNAT superfamily N-acetyltransferase
MTTRALQGISTRLARPQDAPAVAHLVRLGFATWDWAEGWTPDPVDVEDAQVAERLARPGVWCLLATSGGRPAGQATLAPALTEDDPPEPIAGLGHLRHLFVAPDGQGTGLAAHLLSAALGEAAARGYARVRLWTPRDNARARAFYRREGWRENGVELLETRFGLPLVQMVIDLRPA